MMRRSAMGLVAMGALTLAAWLAWHHPLSPSLALLAVLLATAAAAAWPNRWPIWSLPLLPLVGLMPWTGWLVVEELDLLLLAIAAGGYARESLVGAEPGQASHRARPPAGLAVWWLAPVAVSLLLSAWRGVADAGGIGWGWWQGYHEPLNSLRLAKSFAETLLLLPLWQRAQRVDPAQAWRGLQIGMALMLGTVALGVWWERWAFTGLLDFSSDYRATGLFWEMHVGGAALDAALCMSMPFAFMALRQARGLLSQSLLMVVLLMGAYAALATFSRVVYVGAPVALGLAWWLGRRQAGGPGRQDAGTSAALLWSAGVAVLSAWLFPAGGYRSLLALLGAVGLVLAGAESVRTLSARAWGQGLSLGALAAVAVALTSVYMPKGAYVAYGLTWCAGAVLIARARRSAGRGQAMLAASLLAVLAALVAVGVNWGGAGAWAPGLAAAGLLVLVLLGSAARRQPSWPTTLQWQGQVLALLVVLAGVVGVFGGGAYMGQRFTHTSADGEGRQEHWKRALSWLNGSDWFLGKGLGRFAANFGLSGRTEDQVGDYRLAPGEAAHGQVLVLTGGKHELGNGELFRVTQRVAVPASGPLTLSLQIRTEKRTAVHVEVSEKHLLYPMAYTDQTLDALQPGSGWQTMHFELKGADLTGGPFFAPRWVVFAIALDTPGSRVELDDLDLRDSQGRALLVNGDFEQGLARWFSSSDRHHMPWHAKNVAVHVLFEQGLLGLLAVGLAAGVAFWRVSFGAARAQALAPALAGALAGVAVVGLGDSLFDMPRIAWCLWWLVAVALLLPGKRA